MGNMLTNFAAVTVLALVAYPLSSGELTGLSAQARPEPAANSNGAVLVELFTSEGCSSCPPADALLRQINGTRSAAGQLIVGISEHVTYWNSLGWSDPFSADTYTDRQNAYGSHFHLDSVYTPQMVINGTEQIVGGDRTKLEQAFHQESSRPRMALRIVSSSLDQTSTKSPILKVSFAHGETPGAGAVDVFAVLADDMDHSSVLHGENSGRTLTHVAVARSLLQVARVQAAGETTVQVPIPAKLKLGSGGHHLVLFAQAAHYGPVLGTDTQPL